MDNYYLFKNRRVAKRSVEPSHDYEQLLAGEPQVLSMRVPRGHSEEDGGLSVGVARGPRDHGNARSDVDKGVFESAAESYRLYIG